MEDDLREIGTSAGLDHTQLEGRRGEELAEGDHRRGGGEGLLRCAQPLLLRRVNVNNAAKAIISEQYYQR